MAQLKAILFDVDETLLDWRYRARSWEDYEREHLERVHAYVHHNLQPMSIDADDFYEVLMSEVFMLWGNAKQTLEAPHLGKVLVTVFQKIGIPDELLDQQVLMDAYQNQLVPGVKAFPDVVSELPKLRDYGLKFGIVTNALQPMSMRDIELEQAGLMGFFENTCRLSAADVGFLKPHPRIFEEALQQLGVKVDEAIFIGDNLRADVSGAQGIGMKAILRERDESLPYTIYETALDEIVPDGRITTLVDLYPLLDAWYPDWR